MRYYIFVFTALFSFNCLAQTATYNPDQLAGQRLIDKLDKLEKDLNILQKQFYKGDEPQLSHKQTKTYPKMEVRIDALEEQLRNFAGQIEEAQHQARNASNKIDKIAKDIDFRLNTIEQKTNANAAATPITVPNTTTNDAPKVNQPKVVPQNDSKAEHTLVGKLENATKESTAPLDEIGQYDKAFEYLRNSDYATAEVSLRDFIASNQKSELVSNAYYWLGETYYVRNDYEKSAVNFLKGYQDQPKGNKAADSLLKLGMSLDKLKKKKEACTTYNKLTKEFPNADKDIKERVAQEKKRLACS